MTRHVRPLTLLVAATTALFAVTACASPTAVPTTDGLAVSDVWARPAMAGAGSMGDAGSANSAVYMTLRNGGEAAERLLRVDTTMAESVELHNVSEENGVMSMFQVNGIDIPAGGEVQLAPGGFHVMLIGLTESLVPGDLLPLTLHFQNAGVIPVVAEVRQ